MFLANPEYLFKLLVISTSKARRGDNIMAKIFNLILKFKNNLLESKRFHTRTTNTKTTKKSIQTPVHNSKINQNNNHKSINLLKILDLPE